MAYFAMALPRWPCGNGTGKLVTLITTKILRYRCDIRINATERQVIIAWHTPGFKKLWGWKDWINELRLIDPSLKMIRDGDWYDPEVAYTLFHKAGPPANM